MVPAMTAPALAMVHHHGDEPVLDLDHLNAFTDGDASLERELAGLYLTSASHYLAAMTSALRQGQSWTASAHALKGASANLGARRVAALARLAERTAPDAGLLDELRALVDQVRDVFVRRTDSGPGA